MRDERNTDWDKLTKARIYCSTPEWLPVRLRNWYENKFWKACKIHDSDRGAKTQVTKRIADKYFLYNLRVRCHANFLIAWISYLFVKFFGK